MPELQLDGDSLNITSKIKIFGKETVLTKDQHNQEQFNVIASEYIDATLRPRAVALDGIVNKKIRGKNFTNLSTDICLGITEKLANPNRKIFLKTQGTIIDPGLTGGILGQSVYINASGFLSLTQSICKVGYLIKTTTPTVYLNIGTESSNVDLTVAFDAIPHPYIASPSLDVAFGRFKRDFEFLGQFTDSVALPTNAYNIATNGSTLVTAGSGGIFYSTNNGNSWTAATIPPDVSSNSWTKVSYVNGYFVATTNSFIEKAIVYSADGITWSSSLKAGALMKNIATGAGTNVGIKLLDSTNLYNSTNRFSWDKLNNNGWAASSFKAVWYDPRFAYQQYIVLANNGLLLTSQTSGATWVEGTLPEANTWTSIAQDPFGGTLVAVSRDGTNRVMTSPDGTNWTLRTAAEQNAWECVCFSVFLNLFVAVASSGTNRVMTSPDGITWTARSASQQNSWKGVTWGSTRFIAVSSDGTNRVMTSPDGITWTNRTAAEQNSWQSIAWKQSSTQAVAVSSDGTNRTMYSSDNGITWTAVASVEQNSWQAVMYDTNSNVFWAVSNDGTNRRMWSSSASGPWTADAVPLRTWDGVYNTVIVSSDGAIYDSSTLQTGPTEIYLGVGFGNSTFVVVGAGVNRVKTSPDGINWTSRTPSQNNTWQAVAYGAGTFVAVASDGTNRVMTSPDGITWTNQTASQANSWQSVTYGAGLFVAVSIDGTNRVMTSPDGITWTNRNASSVNQWSTVMYSTTLNLFVAINSITATIMTSPDGITWTDYSVFNGASGYEFIYYETTLSQFIAYRSIGAAKVTASPDLLTWVDYPGSLTTSFGIAFGSGKYVVVTDGLFKVWYSTDLINWSVSSYNTTDALSDIAFGAGLFAISVLAGTNEVITSPDALTWVPRTTSENAQWTNIIFNNGIFLMVGKNGTRNSTKSADGITWVKAPAIPEANEKVTYGNGYFMSNGFANNGFFIISSTIDEVFVYFLPNPTTSMTFANNTIYLVIGTLLYRVPFNAI